MLKICLRWVFLVVGAALLLFLATQSWGQASPYNISSFKAQIFTASGQTGAPIQLNGLSAPTSTIGSSFASGCVTITGTSLSSVTFSIQASSDNGTTYPALLPLIQLGTSTFLTTPTVTANTIYCFSLAGLTHVRIVTSGAFSATAVSFLMTASPNAQISSSSGGGGGGAVNSVFGRTGDVIAVDGDYTFAQLAGSLTADQISAAGTLSNSTTGKSGNTAALANVVIAGSGANQFVPVATSATAGIWRRLTQDDIAPGFTINSFTGGSNVEIGATITNPTFAATYSATPTSATITNTAGIDSPLTLVSPFTSGTVIGAFTATNASTVTFTLNAVAAVTKTATSAIQWLPRYFGGVGPPGATATVTASGNNAALSNGAVLASAGLSNSQVGTVIGTYSPSNQSIYVLLIGGTHTFTDSISGFALPFNTPTPVTFVNQNGATVAMFLYQSTNSLNGTFAPRVAS